MSCSRQYLITVLSVVAIVSVAAEEGDNYTALAASKTSNKRGLSGLTGIPGVLYSQYPPHSPHVQTVPVPHPYPVPVPHPVPVQVPRPFPVTVHKPVGLPVPVGVPVPVRIPVPKPYPVPVPVNLPHGPSPLSSFGASPYGPHSEDFGGAFSSLSLGASGPGSFSGKFGYGLGIYGSGGPTLPLGPPGLAAGLAPSPLAGHPPGLPPFGDPFASHQPKY